MELSFAELIKKVVDNKVIVIYITNNKYKSFRFDTINECADYFLNKVRQTTIYKINANIFIVGKYKILFQSESQCEAFAKNIVEKINITQSNHFQIIDDNECVRFTILGPTPERAALNALIKLNQLDQNTQPQMILVRNPKTYKINFYQCTFIPLPIPCAILDEKYDEASNETYPYQIKELNHDEYRRAMS